MTGILWPMIGDLETAEERHALAVVNDACRAGKITAESRERYLAKYLDDPEGTQWLLDHLFANPDQVVAELDADVPPAEALGAELYGDLYPDAPPAPPASPLYDAMYPAWPSHR